MCVCGGGGGETRASACVLVKCNYVCAIFPKPFMQYDCSVMYACGSGLGVLECVFVVCSVLMTLYF